MTKFGALLAGTATAACLAVAIPAGPAAAGPCTDQIDQVGRALSGSGKEAGTLAGAAPGSIEGKAPMPDQGAQAAGPTGKEAGTLAGAAPDGRAGAADPAQGRATSPQDVRLQQAGQPTAAQGGDPKAMDDRMTMARMELGKARDLDQQGSADCAAALDRARKAMGS